MRTFFLYAFLFLIAAALIAGTYSVDTSGNVAGNSFTASNSSCPGCAGAIDLPAGSDPGTKPNSFTWAAPATMTAPVIWYGPGAPCSGYVFIDATGHTSCTAGTGGGGGGGSTYTGFGSTFPITDPTLTAFTWRNQGGATETLRGASLYLVAPTDGSSNAVRGREIAAAAPPFSVTIAIVPQLSAAYNAAGLYVTDGTKVECYQIGTAALSGGMQLAVFNSFNEPGSSGSSLASAAVLPVGLWYLKVVDDGTNLTWLWSANGFDFIQFSRAPRLTYLSAISAMGYFVGAHNGTFPAGVTLVSFATGTN